MEIDDCEEDRPCKKRSTGSQRTCEEVSDIKAANFVSNARRAKGSDRSSDQIAHVKTANFARAKGSDRSMDQIAKIKAANIVSNSRRAKGSDRSFKQVAAVKKSNKSAPRSRRQIQQRKFWDRIINRQTVLEQRVSEGIGFMRVYDFERAHFVIQSAIELIPSRKKYVRSEMIGYTMRIIF